MTEHLITIELRDLIALYDSTDRGEDSSPFGVLFANDSVRAELVEHLSWEAWDAPGVETFKVTARGHQGTPYLYVNVGTRSHLYRWLQGQPRFYERSIRLHDLIVFLRDGCTVPKGSGLQVHHINNHHAVNRADNLMLVPRAVHDAFHRLHTRQGHRTVPRASWLQLWYAGACSITTPPGFEAPRLGAAPW